VKYFVLTPAGWFLLYHLFISLVLTPSAWYLICQVGTHFSMALSMSVWYLLCQSATRFSLEITLSNWYSLQSGTLESTGTHSVSLVLTSSSSYFPQQPCSESVSLQTAQWYSPYQPGTHPPACYSPLPAWYSPLTAWHSPLQAWYSSPICIGLADITPGTPHINSVLLVLTLSPAWCARLV
jgi:hypothetical protein